MSDIRVSVTVGSDGRVVVRDLTNNALQLGEMVGYGGLDADVITLFERWLTERDREWREDEIRTFGSLLYRCLFTGQAWAKVQSIIDGARTTDQRVRLELIFPAEPPYSRLAAIPWEYLFRPETTTERGWFLAADPDVVLSRYIPSGQGETTFEPEAALRVLVVVSQPADPRLGPVVSDEVVDTIKKTADQLAFSVSVLSNPAAWDLYQAVQAPDKRPHLVHFMGHGQFDVDRGVASVALSNPQGGTDWVDDRRFAELLTRNGRAPRAVVLHSCEGGKADFAGSYAGLAPQLVRSGVQCVIAMQYPVTNRTAIRFSTSLYTQLAQGIDLDAAVQEARWSTSQLQLPPDPRLLGVPLVYLQNRSALLANQTKGSGR
jgi:hypothetical protein